MPRVGPGLVELSAWQTMFRFPIFTNCWSPCNALRVRPYYVLLDLRPAGGPPTTQKVQAGFDVNLYGNLDRERLPLFNSEGAHIVLNHFESAAQEIQSRAGNHCTVEITPVTDSLVLDSQQHFRPQGILQIRISHARGMDQPEGPSEEFALKAVWNFCTNSGLEGREHCGWELTSAGIFRWRKRTSWHIAEDDIYNAEGMDRSRSSRRPQARHRPRPQETVGVQSRIADAVFTGARGCAFVIA